MHSPFSNHIAILACVLSIGASMALSSCANRGIGPQGGPRDSIPPKVVRELPENGTVNYHAPTASVWFDEYIQLDNVADNVLISPPQPRTPEVKAIGKRLTIHFADSLRDSTTYTIHFGKAICDYNEKNPLNGYALSFATGSTIDSLELYGRVINAEDLNPVTGVVVGIHDNLADSAFSAVPFTRITRSDEQGLFTIQNIRAGTYRLFALNDISRDYTYQPGEALAVDDSLLTPYAQTVIEYDTIAPDSVVAQPYTYFYPDARTLWFYTEDKQRHYLRRTLRDERYCFTLLFAAPQDSLPLIQRLDSVARPLLLQHNATRDTLVYWLTDSADIMRDTIPLAVTYLRSDSLYNLTPGTDTVYAVYRQPRLSEKALEKKRREELERRLDIRSNASPTFALNDTLRLTFSVPVDSLNLQAFSLFTRIDTTYSPLPFTLIPADSAHMRYLVLFPVESLRQYELRIDSAACYDIYGHTNRAAKIQLKARSIEEYATLRVRLAHPEQNAVIQLLSDADKPLLTMPVDDRGEVFFRYLTPKTYYLRLFIDLNRDGRWTTGDLLHHRQPEPVCYFPAKLTLRANWDFEETFDHLALPREDSKPRDIVKPFDPAKKQ